MKPSDEALAATVAFLGQDVMGNAEKLRPRVALDALSVPQNDDGLRLLAANGEWASVVSLADRLEDEAASKAHSFLLRKDRIGLVAPDGGADALSSPTMDPSKEVRVPRSTAAVMARLPYTLVQVTAYIKMQRVAAAKKLLDTLGDLEGEGYLYTETNESFVPFSLRFVAALMPFYLGVPMESQRTLYGILDECVRRRTSAGKPEERALWLHREARVRRALIYLHYSAGQYAVAIQHFNKLLSATDEVHGLSSGSSSPGTRSASQRVQRVLLLQQLACLCLHCGALLLAERACTEIELISEEALFAGSEKEVSTLSHIQHMNEAFLLAFYGRFSEAAARFREIAASIDAREEQGAPQGSSGGSHDGETKLFDAVLTQVQANAVTSQVACMPYCQEGSDPHTAIADLITATESRLKENPRVLASSDAFVADLVRLYTLAGDRKAKVDQLASVLEVFRCDAASLPNLEKLV